MSARYLVRLDDACDTMHPDRWLGLESVLDRHGVKPIVAVVPDNKDPKLMHGHPDPHFWDHVRRWQTKGWSVAMHGHTHVMHPTEAKLLVPLYRRSEFAGLALEEQAEKIGASWRLFGEQGVTPQVWVAPAHSFDRVTLEALRARTPIRVISDGMAWSPYYEDGFHWIPQQLWAGYARRPSGLWTVCLHPNSMDERTLTALDTALASGFKARTLALTDVKLHKRGRSPLDRLYDRYFWWRRRRVQRQAGAH